MKIFFANMFIRPEAPSANHGAFHYPNYSDKLNINPFSHLFWCSHAMKTVGEFVG